jgi:hypothetical protein
MESRNAYELSQCNLKNHYNHSHREWNRGLLPSAIWNQTHSLFMGSEGLGRHRQHWSMPTDIDIRMTGLSGLELKALPSY